MKMPRNGGQKLKLLYLNSFLREYTDENHPVTINDMTSHLAKFDISAERKSLYDDIEQLKLFGTDIISSKGKYYVPERDFQLSEVKLLVDAVQGSKFITQKKSSELIKKLESLVSKYEAASLSRQVLVTNRIKSMNESIYYNVDKIHTAIGSDKKITFKYFEYNPEKQRVLRHNGRLYCVSPFYLHWDDENYYLIAFDGEGVKHYRVDKMQDINITDDARDGKEELGKLDIGLYTKKIFSMFGGEEKQVCMEFDEGLCGAVIDRFGKDIAMRRSENEGKLFVYCNVVVSPPFFGWVFSFENRVKIVSPRSVAEDFCEYCDRVRKLY